MSSSAFRSLIVFPTCASFAVRARLVIQIEPVASQLRVQVVLASRRYVLEKAFEIKGVQVARSISQIGLETQAGQSSIRYHVLASLPCISPFYFKINLVQSALLLVI